MQTALQDKEIRTLTARASQVKDPAIARQAAYKAWRTMRKRKREQIALEVVPLLEFNGESMSLPPEVASGKYVLHTPLVKHSKLTDKAKGGVGKELSDGWVINYAVGCTFGCRFCYVDSIHKKFSFNRVGGIVYNDWGQYFAVPENLDQAIEETNWSKWKGKEVMMSSTHDPFLPQLQKAGRKILEAALPEGVKFCIQTRSPLIERSFDLIAEHKKQVRLQVSVATYSDALSRLIEPRVVPPRRRMEILRKANDYHLTTGIIVAPIFPPVAVRKDVTEDFEEIVEDLEDVRPDHIFGESVHIRGINLAYVEKALGHKIVLNGFETDVERMFHSILRQHGMKGRWWVEH